MAEKDKYYKKYLKIMKLIKAGKLKKALKLTEEKEDLYPLGVIYSQKGKHEIAVKIYDRIIQLNPDADKAWLSKGVELKVLGEYGEALEHIDKSISINPEVEHAWAEKCNVLAYLGRNEEALICYEKLINSNPKNELHWANKGKVLVDLGRYDEALECYERAIEINPNNDRLWFNKAGVFERLDKYDEALVCLDKAIDINPNNERSWSNKASALIKLNRYEEALNCIDEAIRINPNDALIWSNKGSFLIGLNRDNEALEYVDKAISINPKEWKAWINKGVALSSLGQYEEALQCFDESIKINPFVSKAWASKGDALEEISRYDEALECYERAIEINPNMKGAWTGKGKVLSELGRLVESLECLDKMLDMNPNDMFTLCFKYRVLILRKRFNEALEVVNKALNLNPNDERLWFDKGNILGDLGRSDEALDCFERTVNINPNYPGAYGNKGLIYLEKREYDKAIDGFRKARELFTQIKAEKDAAIAYNLEILAINAAELLMRLESLDKRFLNSLERRSLVELKNESIEISKAIENIIEEFGKKELPSDVYELLAAKAVCFSALSKAVNYEKFDKDLLDKAKIIFEKWKLDSFVMAVDSINTFSRLISKYPGIDKIPRENEEYIFNNVLSASYILDGELTDKITDKIKGKPFSLKPIEETRHPNILMMHRENMSVNWVKVAIVQLDYSIQYIPQPYSHTLKEETKEEVREKILSALKIAEEENVDIIGFPELSFTNDLVNEIKSGYKDMIIVCGSFYDEHKYNICPIVINNDVLLYKKCHPSILEEPNGEGMKKGDKIFIIQTKFGIISVLNCIDFDKEFYHLCDEKVDIIVNPRWDIDREYIFQKRADGHIDQPDGSKLHTFILHINCMKAEWAGSVGGGGSCILGYEHRYRLEKYMLDGLRPNDKIKYKICQAQDEMICIASLKVGSITEKRVKMGNWFKYDSNERRWDLLQDKGIWLEN